MRRRKHRLEEKDLVRLKGHEELTAPESLKKFGRGVKRLGEIYVQGARGWEKVGRAVDRSLTKINYPRGYNEAMQVVERPTRVIYRGGLPQIILSREVEHYLIKHGVFPTAELIIKRLGLPSHHRDELISRLQYYLVNKYGSWW